jgi:UDP-glucose 4-epimerase
LRAIVTGGAGFIGSNIVDELIALNHDVFIIDNLSTGNFSNINSQAKFYQIDINSPKLSKVFEEIKPDVVFHLAAQVNVGKSIEDPINDEEINIRGTLNLLENCRLHNVKRIIYSSSAAVYGIPNNLPINEEHFVNPISFYGISKLVPEMYIKTYSSLYGLKYAILRYSNVYGPRQDHRGEGGVISIFLNKVINRENLKVFGDGGQTRDFIYVNDVVSANIAVMDSETSGTFNISTRESIRINDLILIMTSLNHYQNEVVYEQHRSGDIVHSCLDNNLAISSFKWTPKFSMEKGIKETFDYYLTLTPERQIN